MRILDIDVKGIKDRLQSAGAKRHMERNMRRYVYDIRPDDQNTWMRLRDDGEKATLTVKEIHHGDIDGTKETEIIVDDFDKTNMLLNKLGFFHKAYQENKRVSYRLGETHIEIDSWPKIPPYLEIEGRSARDVERAVKLLGFKMSQTTFISVTEVYEKYGLNVHDFKELRF